MGYTITVPGPADLQSNFFSLSSSINQIPFKCYVDPLSNHDNLQHAERMMRQSKKDSLVCCSANTLWVFSLTESNLAPSPPPEFMLTEVTTGLFIPSTLASSHSPPPYYHPFILAVTKVVAHNLVTAYNYMPLGPLLVSPYGYIILIECHLTSSGHLVVTPSCWDARMVAVQPQDKVAGKHVFLSPTGVIGIAKQNASPSREDASFFSDALYFATGVKLEESTKYLQLEVQGIEEAVIWPTQLCFCLLDDHKLPKPHDVPTAKSSPLDEIYQALVCAKTFSRPPGSEISIPSSTGATINGITSAQSTVTPIVYPTPPEQAYPKSNNKTATIISDASTENQNYAQGTDIDGDTRMENVYNAAESLTPGLRWSSTPGAGGIGTDTWDSMNEELFGNDNEITEADFNFFDLPDSGGGIPPSAGPLESSTSPSLESKNEIVSAKNVEPRRDEKMISYSEQQLRPTPAEATNNTRVQPATDRSQNYVILPDGRRQVKTDFDYITISPDPSEMLDKKYVLGGRFYITKEGLSKDKSDEDYTKNITSKPRMLQIVEDDEDDASSMNGEEVDVFAESDAGDEDNNNNNNLSDEVLGLPLQIVGHGIPAFVPMSASDYSAFLTRTLSNEENKDNSEEASEKSDEHGGSVATLDLEKSCQRIVHLSIGDPWESIRVSCRPVFSLNVDISNFASVLDIVVSRIIEDDELMSCILSKPLSKVALSPDLISSVKACLGKNARVLSLGDISRLEESPTGVSSISRNKPPAAAAAASPFMLRADEHLGKLANSSSRTSSRFNSPLFSNSPGIPSEGEGTEPMKLLDPPKFMVRRGDYNMEISPYGLRFWETLGLTPIEGSKNLTAFMLYPDKNRLSSLCSFFLDYLKSTYEAANCGTFNFGSIDNFERGLVPLPIPNSQSEKISLTSSLFQVCAQLGKSLGSQSQFSKGNNVIMIAYPVDNIPDLFTICSAYRELSIAFLQEASKFFEDYDIPILQIIPLSFFAPPSYPLVPPRYHIFRLCLRIYDKCLIEEKSKDDNPVSENSSLSPIMLALSKRKHLPKINNDSVTEINSTANITNNKNTNNNNDHESPASNFNQEDGVFTYSSRKTPFATIAKPPDVKVTFTTGPPSIGKLDSARLHVAYGKSCNKKWASACWTNLHGDLLDNVNIPLVTKSAFPKSCEDVCVDIWNHTADIIASMRSSWTVVITRLGELDTDELNVWVNLTNHLAPNVELCLVSINPNPSLSLQPASLVVRETESTQPGAAPLQASGEGSYEMSPAFPQRYYESPELYGATPTGSGMIVTTPGSGTPTPATYGSAQNEYGGDGDKDGFKLDKDTLLVDMEDRAYGVLTRLVGFSTNDGEWQPCLSKAYMVKPSGSSYDGSNAVDDSMLTSEVALVHCSKMPPKCDEYLMNILSEFRDLASLGQVKGIDLQKTSVGPMHVSIVERVLRFLECLP